ncbi:type II toxin-antitoxin system RelB/DinJ family antitoxin [Christensenellaceae bacterium OttesenSCG-928-M15]|nr:type II toxin-antitoxin system RelB/DinJ family antitoxin [Christensenellaceae bacterium OttesenSCG-928-M15]
MGQTNINIRMDENLKQDFDKMCGELGMNMTTAFNIFARTVVRQHGIPFPVALDTPNAETLAAIEDVNKRRNMRGPFGSVQALMEDLNADD